MPLGTLFSGTGFSRCSSRKTKLGRRSSVYSLDEDLREDLLAKWRSRRYSLLELAKLSGGKISRSSLHRFLRAGDAALDRQLTM